MSRLRAYPYDDWDNLPLMADTPGSFWSQYFEDKKVVRGIFKALQLFYRDWEKALLEAEQTLNRNTIPVYTFSRWAPLVLVEAAEGAGDSGLARYGEDYTYGGALVYGIPVVRDGVYRFPLASDVREIGFLFNRLSLPTFGATAGTDFEVGDGYISLGFDPFARDDLAVRTVAGSRQVLLWAYATKRDSARLWTHLGYIYGLKRTSSEAYRLFLNAVTDAHVAGPTRQTLMEALSAMSGIPLARATESVLEVLDERDAKAVVTATNVYRICDTGYTPAQEEQLTAGEPVLSAFEVYRASDSTAVQAGGGIYLPPGFFNNQVQGSLFFSSDLKDLNYLGVENGLARVSFEVGGSPQDVSVFWATVREREDSAGKSLADWLDTRLNPVSAPLAHHMPSRVRPSDMVAPFLGAGFLTVLVEAGAMPAARLGFSSSRLLRDALPPRVGVVVLLQLSVQTDSVILGQDGQVECGVAGEVDSGILELVEGSARGSTIRGAVL